MILWHSSPIISPPKARSFTSNSLPLYQMPSVLPSLTSFSFLTFHTERFFCCARKQSFNQVDISRRLNCREAWTSQRMDGMGSACPSFPSEFQFSPHISMDGLLVSTASPPSVGSHLMQSPKLSHCIPTQKHHQKGRTPQALPQSCKWLRSEISQSKQTDKLNASCLPTEQLTLGGEQLLWTWSETAVSVGKRELGI